MDADTSNVVISSVTNTGPVTEAGSPWVGVEELGVGGYVLDAGAEVVPVNVELGFASRVPADVEGPASGKVPVDVEGTARWRVPADAEGPRVASSDNAEGPGGRGGPTEGCGAGANATRKAIQPSDGISI